MHSNKIVKRDGTWQEFDSQKIMDAIIKAFKSVDGEVDDYSSGKAYNIAEYIEEKNEEEGPLTIDEIQDLVENGLMSTKRKDVARAYIKYRADRDRERRQHNSLMIKAKKKLEAQEIDNQNANVDEHSFGGRKGETASVVLKEMALDSMSEKSRKNHMRNRIYIHDLDSYELGMHNCLSIPFDVLLAEGFKLRGSDLRPANSVGSAFQQLAVIFQIQSLQQFGGVSATHLDWTMVPYVQKSFYKHFQIGLKYCEDYEKYYYDDALEEEYNHKKLNIDNKYAKVNYPKAFAYATEMTEKELNQAVEAMYHNLNSLQSRSGDQLPFTSINYGTCTSAEGRLVTKALIEGCIAGIGKFHRTAIFPCGIFQCMKGVNRKPGDPNYDLFRLALRSTAQRLYPNYANVDWSGNEGYDRNDPRTYFSTMGCRTANGYDINGFGQLKDGRGNICPVTIILPTLAMEALDYAEDRFDAPVLEHQYIECFLEILGKAINDAKDMLIERYKHICSQSPKSAKFMYENNVMAGYIPEEGIESALKHGTLAIGQLGLAEALQILIGYDHTIEDGMEYAKEIEQLFKNKCSKFKEEYHLNFGVYMTPAETLCYTAMQKFKDKYGIIPNVSDKEFFTNSIHVPVWYECDPFEKIDIESQLTGYSSAGCITYIELGEAPLGNEESLEEYIQIAVKAGVHYLGFNFPKDVCNDCGTTGVFDACPKCNSNNITRIRRVSGYLEILDGFTKGKKAEEKNRRKN